MQLLRLLPTPALALALLTLLGACDTLGLGGDDGDDAPAGLYPVLIEGRWGYINGEGRITVIPQFDDGEGRADEDSGGRVPFAAYREAVEGLGLHGQG